MRDTWLHDHLGDEARPTAHFEAELADTLHAAWADPQASMTVSPQQPAAPRRSLRPWLAAAAAVAVFGAGGIYLAADDGKPQITGESTVTTLAPSTSVETTAVETTASTSPPTTVAPTTVPTPVVASTPEEQAVLDYLAALDQGRWTDAAKLLGEGGLSWEERADLRPLTGTDGALNDLPAALQAWCESPAMCRLPTALTTDPVSNRIVATFTIDDVERSSIFVGGTFEGSPLVRGLPLRLPPEGVPMDEMVVCQTAGVERTLYADLDADGWDEVIVDTQDEAFNHTLSVCGTTLVVPSLFIGSPNTFVLWTLDVGGDGSDELMTGGFNVDTLFAAIIKWDGTELQYTGQEVTNSNPVDGNAGTSFGCENIVGAGGSLVQYTYQYESGTDLSNSTALTFSRTILNDDGTVNPIPLPAGRYELPAQEQEAFRLIAGYCGNLPVQTD